jgi:phosphoglycolate phosphatase
VDIGADLRLVVFDLDGTLLHLEVDWVAVRRRLGLDATGETVGAAIERLMAAGDPALEAVTAEELRGLGEGGVPAHILPVLDRLATSYRLAVCTRNSREVVRRAFAGASVWPALDVVGREDVDRLKPDPQGLRILLERAGVVPEQAVLVGDTSHDVLAARAAGMASVVVANERLAYAPPGADAYIDAISDLPQLLLGAPA